MLNIVTIPALLGPLLGPVLGGIIVQYISWHWIFLINIPVGLAGLWATRKLMPDLKAVKEQKFDWPGFLFFSASALLITMSLSTEGGSPDKTRMGILLTAGILFQTVYWGAGVPVGNAAFQPLPVPHPELCHRHSRKHRLPPGRELPALPGSPFLPGGARVFRP